MTAILPYFKKSAEFLDNTEQVSLGWLIHYFNYITYAVAIAVAQTHLQSDEIVAKLQPAFAVAESNFFRDTEARQHTNMEYLLDNIED
jgi:hypothetical protein